MYLEKSNARYGYEKMIFNWSSVIVINTLLNLLFNLTILNMLVGLGGV